MTLTRTLALAALLSALGPLARAETAAPASEGAEGAEGEVAETLVVTVPLNVSGADYAAEVTPQDDETGPHDLRLRRADGATMADQGYLVPELGAAGCHGAGLRFDDGLPHVLAADGSWQVQGGCR